MHSKMFDLNINTNLSSAQHVVFFKADIKCTQIEAKMKNIVASAHKSISI